MEWSTLGSGSAVDKLLAFENVSTLNGSVAPRPAAPYPRGSRVPRAFQV
ncbi:MAG: hypothetical protein HY319_02115 [Armatimonadetes bacterium]|nr:hypothetical protein [Armatimonadota bacterium]